MARNHNTTEEKREEHLEQVSRMLVMRVPKHEIARRLGVTPAQITYDTRIVMERWKERQARSYEEHVRDLCSEIDEVRRVAWEQWVLSCEDGRGDARYLEQVNKCNREERAILGIDAPTRVQVETAEHEWTDDELQRLASDMASRYGEKFGKQAVPVAAPAVKRGRSASVKAKAGEPKARQARSTKPKGKPKLAKKAVKRGA